MTLSQGMPQDAQAVLALYRQQLGLPYCSWNEHYPDEALVRADIEAGALRVAREEGRLLAAVTLLDTPDEELQTLTCWSQGRACEATRLCVAPDRQGQGVAGAVMRALEKEARARGFAYLRLLCATTNAPARRVYERQRYALRGECRFWNENFLCFEKNLTSI